MTSLLFFPRTKTTTTTCTTTTTSSSRARNNNAIIGKHINTCKERTRTKISSTSAEAVGNKYRNNKSSIKSSNAEQSESNENRTTRMMERMRAWWTKSSKIDRRTIASLGSACLLSYGFVSNLFYVSSLLLATYTAVKTTGQSPVTSQQSLKVFASSYFGLWMIQNVLRPARFAFSVAISPRTDKVVEFFQKFAPGQKKSIAFGMTVFAINVVGTIAYMFAGFALIYAVTGVPLDVGKLFSAAIQAKKSGGLA